MPPDFGFLPEGLWGPEYRAAGGINVADYMSQSDVPEVDPSIFEEAPAPMPEPGPQFNPADFVDWPTYQSIVGGKLKPHEAYDEYVNIAAPAQLRAMGYSDEEIQAELQAFASTVPPPAPDYGFFGNLWESATSGVRSGTRAARASGNVLQGDLDDIAKLVVEQSSDRPAPAPMQRFQNALNEAENSTDWWEAFKAYPAAILSEPQGTADWLANLVGMMYPSIGGQIAGAGAGALAGSAVPGIGTVAGGIAGGMLGTGAGSMTSETGSQLLERIANEAQKRGIDPRDGPAIRAMLDDPVLYEGLRNAAAIKGAVVAAGDMVTAGAGLKLGSMAGAARTAGQGRRALGLGAGAVAAETAGDPAFEAASQAAAGDNFNWTEIWGELFGGGLQGAVSGTTGAVLGRAGLRNREAPAPGSGGDIEESDLPGAGGGGALPPVPTLTGGIVPNANPTLAVGPEGGAFVPTPENVAARDRALQQPPGPGGIDVTELPAEEINIGVPPGTPPGIEVTEITPEEITILPAQWVDSAEQRIAEGRLLPFQPNPPLVAGPQGVGTPQQMEQQRLQQLTTPQDVELTRGRMNDETFVRDWLAERGFTPTSADQEAALINVLATPANQRQEAIAESIAALADSKERGAETATDALLALSRALPADPRPKPTPQQAAANLVRDLGVAPNQVLPTVTSALAQEMVDNIAAGVTDVAETKPTAAGVVDTDPLVTTPVVHAKRGLKRGEALPDTGLAALAAQLAGPVGRAQGAQGQPRSGLRSRVRQEGTGGGRRTLARTETAAPAGSATSVGTVANDTEGTPGVPRLVRGVAYGSQPEDIANKEALAQQKRDLKAKKEVAGLRKRAIDAVTMTKEEYEKTYPGRNYDDDLGAMVDVPRESAGEVPLTAREREIVRHDAVGWLSANHPSPLVRGVFTFLRSEGLDVPVVFDDTLQNFGAYRSGYTKAGQFARQVVLHSDAGWSTLVHELIHAATMRALTQPVDETQVKARQHLEALMNYAKQHIRNPDRFVRYGLTDVYEFVSEAIANPNFQRELDAIKLPGRSRFSVWGAIKRLVMNLLGRTKSDTLLTEALLNVTDLLQGAQITPEGRKVLLQEGKAKITDQSRAVPSSAILGTKDGERTYIAYAKSKDDPNTSYTLYQVTPASPRGDPTTKIPNLSRQQVEQYISAGGSTALAPANSVAGVKQGPPKNTSTKKVGYGADGNLQSVAFEQKDGSWTYYESDDDVRTDPDARVTKGLSLDQVQRAISARGLAIEPPAPSKVKTTSSTPTAVGYEPAGNFRRSFQDMEATLKNIAHGVDVDATLRNSRVARAWNKALKNYIEPARKVGAEIAQRYGRSQEQIEELLQNLHVSERMQVKIQQYLRGNLPEAERAAKVREMQAKQTAAEKYVQDAQRSNLAFVNAVKQELSPKIKAMSDNTIDLAAQYGLISRDTAESIKKAYDYYVPLQTGDRTTTGKAATGANVASDRSFGRMVEQVSRTIARGEMNRVRKSVLDLVRESGLLNKETGKNPVLVVDDKDPAARARETIRYDPATNSLNLGVDNHVFDDNAIDVYEDGHRVRMVIDDDSLLEALHPYKGEQRKTAGAALLGVLARVNHIVSIGKTSLNPAWPPFNFARDVLTANLNLPAGVSRTKFLMQLANPATYASVLWNVAREAFGGEPQGLYADAKDAGGFISHRQYLGGTDEVAAETMALFQPSATQRLKKLGRDTFDVLAIWPQVAESVPRFAMYKAALESGMSRDKAAVAAKTASVNFEQRGRKNLSNWWIFGNAKMQGIHALVQTYKRVGPAKAAMGAAAIVSLGALAAALGYENSDKDKDGKSKYAKIPNYKKDSLVLFSEGGKGIPIPQEISPLYVLGHAVMEAVMGGTSKSEASSRVMTSFVNNAWPGNVPQTELAGHKADGLEFLFRAILPSYVLPAADIITNKNTFGSPVVSGLQDKLKKGMPKSEMGSPNEDQLAVNTAKGIYNLTGGAVDVAPQQVKLLNNFFNPATEGYAFVRDLFSGRDPKYRGEIVNPFARKFTGAATDFYDSDQFEELLAKSARAKFLAEQRGIDSLSPEEQALARSAAMLAKVNSDANNLFKGNKLLTKERRDLLNERKREMILGAIGRYNDQRDRTVPKQ